MQNIQRERALLTYRLGQADLLWKLHMAEFSRFENQSRRLATIAVILRMWNQYKIDRAEEIYGSLISDEDIAQRNLFFVLITSLFGDNALVLGAIDDITKVIGSDYAKHKALNAEMKDEIDALCTMSAEIKRLTSSNDTPDTRIAKATSQFAMLNLDSPDSSFIGQSNCWMINLALASASIELGLTASPLPYPALIRRQLLRIDRDDATRTFEFALSVRKSVEITINDLLSLSACRAAWIKTVPNLQRNNRSLEVYRSLLTFGQMTPLGMARLLSDRGSHDGTSLSEPGARKLLRQLLTHGFAIKSDGTANFRSVRKFSVELPTIEWLKGFDNPCIPEE